MSEDMFLLLFGLSFGVPLLIAFTVFAIFMVDHNRYLNEKLKELEEDDHE